MNDLSEFLQARIAEDEAAAREVPGPVDYGRRLVRLAAILGRPEPAWAPSIEYVGDYSGELQITKARVLAECDAKQRLIAAITERGHAVVDDCWYTCSAATEEHDGGTACDDSRFGKPCDCGRDATVARDLGLLALPYADHPDYREEWLP